MIVLHGAWIADSEELAVWAEDGDLPRIALSRRGRRPRRPRPKAHPFALDADGIRATVTQLVGPAAAELMQLGEGELVVRLPEVDGGPVGSPWLDDEPGDPGGPQPMAAGDERVTLVPWTVPAGKLGVGDAVRFLLDARRSEVWQMDEHSLGDRPGVAFGADIRFAARAVEMVLELAARGRVLPSLDLVDGDWRARWRPTVSLRDRGRVEALLWAMPSAFAAVDRLDPGDGSPDVGPERPHAILRSLMWSTTDAVCRQLAGGVPTGPRRARTKKADVVAPWVEALAEPEGIVRADPVLLLPLAEHVQSWLATQSSDLDPVRTCFRIVPPTDRAEDETESDSDQGPAAPAQEPAPTSRISATEDDEEWRIEFVLQAVDDPSLIVSAADVWSDGMELTALERHVTYPDEALLRGLGRAARLVPTLGPALVAATPTDHRTDAAGALDFLRHGAPILEEAGFGVLAPPWWRPSRTRLGLRMRARSAAKGESSSGTLGLQSLCDIRWEAVLGDDTLGIAELRALARLKQPLVRRRGQWVELRQEELAAAIAAVGRKGASAEQLTAGEVLRMGIGLGTEEDGLPIADVEADGWLGGLLSGAEDRRLEAIASPEGFAGQLRPYQERGLGWLSFLGELGLGACLADDMGLGKTAQLLALLIDERARTGVHAGPGRKARGATGRRSPPVRDMGPTLVLCPMSLVGNWQREVARFAPKLTVYVHHGPDRLTGKEFARLVGASDLVLSTYGLATRDLELLSTVPWRRVVLDEAQQIKNSAARTTKSVRALPAERRIAMTGTPVENRLGELWSIMEFLNPGMLGSERTFHETFAVPIERQADELAAARLRRITGPFVLRRLKTDRSIIADLPDKLEMREFCTLTREQASLYQAVVDDMLAKIDESTGIERRGLVLATMMKLKQVCNHPAHFLGDGSSLAGRSGKVARLLEVLAEAVAEGDRTLVFTQFTEMGTMLERYLRSRLGCDVLWLHGGVRKKARDEMVERFQGGDGPPIFLLSLKAGGTGLNLTAATQVVHFDRWWNPAVEDQATDRAYRIGQKRNVQVRKFVCGGTLEERIDAMIEVKRSLADRIVGTGEGWITELSTDQLREVIALSADAVEEE